MLAAHASACVAARGTAERLTAESLAHEARLHRQSLWREKELHARAMQQEATLHAASLRVDHRLHFEGIMADLREQVSQPRLQPSTLTLTASISRA